MRITRQVRRQHLDRHFARELFVARAVDLAHAAGTEGTEDLVRAERRSNGERHRGARLFIVETVVPVRRRTRSFIEAGPIVTVSPSESGVGRSIGFPATRV